ncbi:hypothetical protein PAHA111176_13085 [Parendozoicomonas haliclonae]|uniref:Uncharacterized protein n=2 Tax=Parendozoicomonas haliclonae TaxID=1960125 RepID=A0A1X7AIF9_9GAMM|nr:hypothetical protein EHSB41UT_01794 [Parendozoicomonas haliclonae]
MIRFSSGLYLDIKVTPNNWVSNYWGSLQSRGFVFVVLGLFILPVFFQDNGVWGSILMAEVLTLLISVYTAKRFFTANQPGALALNN